MMTQALSAMVELRLNGVAIETCESATAALQHIGDTDYDAIVSDVKMPGMDGFQLIEQVRSDPAHAALRVVVITGCTNADTPERVRKLGINAFFSKPYSPIQVRYKVEQLLND